MGMYTGVRCKVIIKKEHRDEMNRLHDELNYMWDESTLDFMKEYGDYSRATFIPRGCLCYMPDSWEKEPYDKYGDGVPSDGFETNFDFDCGLWSFQCSLKNYDSTIEYFIENVLSKIVEDIIHFEVFYEEDEYSTLYELKNGEIIVKTYEGIKY